MSSEVFEFNVNNDQVKNAPPNYTTRSYDYITIRDSNNGAYPGNIIRIRSSSAAGRDVLKCQVLWPEAFIALSFCLNLHCDKGGFQTTTDFSKVITPNASHTLIDSIDFKIQGTPVVQDQQTAHKNNFTMYNRFASTDQLERYYDTLTYETPDLDNQVYTVNQHAQTKLHNMFGPNDKDFATKSKYWNTWSILPPYTIFSPSSTNQLIYSNSYAETRGTYTYAAPTQTDPDATNSVPVITDVMLSYRAYIPLSHLHDIFNKLPATLIAGDSAADIFTMDLGTSISPSNFWDMTFDSNGNLTSYTPNHVAGSSTSVPFSFNLGGVYGKLVGGTNLRVTTSMGFFGPNQVDQNGVSLIMPCVLANPKLDLTVIATQKQQIRYSDLVYEDFSQQYAAGQQCRLAFPRPINRIRKVYLIPLYNELSGCGSHIKSIFTTPGLGAYVPVRNVQLSVGSRPVFPAPLLYEGQLNQQMKPYLVEIPNGNSLSPDNGLNQHMLPIHSKLAALKGHRVLCFDMTSLMDVDDQQSDDLERYVNIDFQIEPTLKYASTLRFSFHVIIERELITQISRLPLAIVAA